MARLAEAGGDHEQQERSRAKEVEEAERCVPAGAAGVRLAARQGKRERQQADDAQPADIEH